MRAIGMAERALDLTIARAVSRKTFGKFLAEHGTVVHDIAHMRMEIEQSRLLVLKAANSIDLLGAKGALREIGMIKVNNIVSRVCFLGNTIFIEVLA
jgi:acyl-CoA dehydrogenase